MALSPGSAQVAAAWLGLSWAGSRPALCAAARAVPSRARGTARTTAGGEVRVLNTLRSRLRDGAAVRQGREQLIQQSLSRPDRGVC